MVSTGLVVWLCDGLALWWADGTWWGWASDACGRSTVDHLPFLSLTWLDAIQSTWPL